MTSGFGYYGKVPARGDFVRRGLGPEFVEPWDRWVQSVLRTGREVLGPGWQEAYFSAPIWRFALPAGLCGADAVIGVLMPSVDRVGRHFPLTVAAPVAAPSAWSALRSAAALYPPLEEAALTMLEDDADCDRLDTLLAPLVPPGPRCEPRICRSGEALTLTAPADGAAEAMAAAYLARELGDPSTWSCEVEGGGRLMACRGLPEGDRVRELLDPAAPAWKAAAAPSLTPAGL